MMWHVGDDGRVEVRLKAQGEQAIRVARVKADRYIADIIGDWATNFGIDALFDEMRYSFSKTRPEVTIIWKARVPEDRVADVRDYLMRLATSQAGLDELDSGGGGDAAPDQ